MHRQTVLGAIDRKAKAVERNRDQVAAALRAEGISVPADFRVPRLVVLNSEMHAGFRIQEVTVVDENILRMFFEGEIVDMAVGERDGGMREVKKRVFYRTPEEAYVAAFTYFATPPQLDAFRNGVKEQTTPVLAIDDSDWRAKVHSLDCQIVLPGAHADDRE